MEYQFKLESEAEQDLRKILRWYKKQIDPDLDTKFFQAYTMLKNRILAGPDSFPIVLQKYHLRKALISHFPYIIFFYLENQNINVVAIIHEKRKPNHWESRVG